MEGLSLSSVLNKLLKNDDGAAAIEYGLIVALVAIVLISATQAVGSSLTSVFNNVASSL